MEPENALSIFIVPQVDKSRNACITETRLFSFQCHTIETIKTE